MFNLFKCKRRMKKIVPIILIFSFSSALGLYLEPLTQHVSAPLPPSFTRPLIAWISCLFNRLIHLLCLFTSFPLTLTFSHPLPPSISLSLSLLMGNYTNKCSLFPSRLDFKGENNEWIYPTITVLF